VLSDASYLIEWNRDYRSFAAVKGLSGLSVFLGKSINHFLHCGKF
jgi:hypothetical protein